MSKRNLTKDAVAMFSFTLPGVFCFIVFFIVPMLMGFYYSFTDWNGISRVYDFVGLRNFMEMFHDSRIVSSLKFSMTFTVFYVALVNLIALVLAFLLNVGIKGKGFFRAMYFFPAVVSLVVVGLIFDQIFYHVVPMLGRALDIEALQSNILGSPRYAPMGILLIKLWREIPIPTVLYIAGLQSVPRELVEAALMDGASFLQRLRRVIFPFLVPVVSMNLVLTVRGGIMVFDIIQVTTKGGPGYCTSSIGITIYSLGYNEMKFGMSTALSLLLFFLIAGISFLQIHLLKRKGTGQL